MNMVHLTKGQIRTINLTKHYPFNMANVMDVCPSQQDLQLETW
jgi:hypothetical protein